MSTKIYDAYRVQGMTARELLDFFIEIRKDFFTKVTIQLSQYPYFKDKDYLATTDELKRIFRSGMRDPFNYVSSVMIYPYENDFYCVFFGMSDMLNGVTYLEELERNETFMKHFSDFHYQNQTDQPDNVTDEEWNLRRDTWDKLISEYSFKRSGLEFTFIDAEDDWEVALAVSRLNRTDKGIEI